MNMPEWAALAVAAAAAACGVRYIILRIRKKHRGCKDCPYADMCGRECEENRK